MDFTVSISRPLLSYHNANFVKVKLALHDSVSASAREINILVLSAFITNYT